jgi:hypothetical protein
LLGPGRDGATRTEDERGLARWLEAEAEGDKGLGVRLQNGGRGVPRGVRRAWGGGAGGPQGADTTEAVADRTPAAQSRGAERGRGIRARGLRSAIVGRPREKGDKSGPKGIVWFLN